MTPRSRPRSQSAHDGGAAGTGINIRDLRAAHAGVVRHDVLAGKSSAGAHVRAGSDPDDVEILLSADATPITEGDERSVEKASCARRSIAEPTAGT